MMSVDVTPHIFTPQSNPETAPTPKPGPINIWMIPCFSKKDRDIAQIILQSVKQSRITRFENIPLVVARCEQQQQPTGGNDTEMKRIFDAVTAERARILELLGVPLKDQT